MYWRAVAICGKSLYKSAKYFASRFLRKLAKMTVYTATRAFIMVNYLQQWHSERTILRVVNFKFDFK